ncbi:hypothetical protein GCM10009799_27260 [Nocardiopsis rhodophaea]|uniref:Uncharacterized protein n=1 Tax=Nocardiopsis rhodophaea TaxID=280238 RepID=A0ABN2T510_9ACTN
MVAFSVVCFSCAALTSVVAICLTGAALTAVALAILHTERRRRDGSADGGAPRAAQPDGGDDAWYHVHRAFGPCSSWMAGIVVVTALLASTVPVDVVELSVPLILTAAVAVTFVWSATARRSPLHRRTFECDDRWD